MKPIKFKGMNAVFAKDQPEYIPLPAKRTVDGIVTSCWKMGFFEWLKVIFTGRVYVSQMTFNDLLQPIKVEA